MSPYEIMMAGGSVEHWNEESGKDWLGRILGHFHRAAWLNPVPRNQWGYTQSIGLIGQLMAGRMFPLTIEGSTAPCANWCDESARRRCHFDAAAVPVAVKPLAEGARAPARASAAKLWPPLARFIAREAALGEAARARGPAFVALYEFVRFGLKQGWACLFGAAMLALIVATHLAYPAQAPLARYDLLVLAAIAIQVAMLASGLETFEEAKVICAFHVIGTLMELHKTSIGSWTYPEASVLRIGGVPLFTGFMYASVGSYLARVWRLFDFRFAHHPPLPALIALSVAIYANFLADHYGVDLRVGLIAVTVLLFARTIIYFKVWRRHRFMPLLVGFVLVALFIWLAENIGTFTGTWLYPRQMQHWTLVPISKLTSWFLLMIISYTMVAWINGVAAIAPALQAAPGGKLARDERGA